MMQGSEYDKPAARACRKLRQKEYSEFEFFAKRHHREGSQDKRVENNNNNNNNNNVECKNKGDTSNNRGDWDYFKVIQQIREQHTRKTCSQGSPENSHVGHCTLTPESTNVKVQ